MSSIYNGPHMHRVQESLAADCPENAASWMERDLGEEDEKVGYGSIDPSSLKLRHTESSRLPYVEFELYADTTKGLYGEGI